MDVIKNTKGYVLGEFSEPGGLAKGFEAGRAVNHVDMTLFMVSKVQFLLAFPSR